ncbi:hypothetical protein [Asticcacaulis sp. EMRT-3]|uniref:hypothetical protein n=1 Tax=Asticcacaulis sp. EMRT-3 TaxID=3040349 RepID=UPI0024AF92DF|nr:hypothetical protein [Asticcacaulis sp. EMRT-3]MDI7775511.1 hypothetical protein [Asticcacaulis sp. EMRT-3]
MQHHKIAPGTDLVRGGGGGLLYGNITPDSIILTSRKGYAGRLSRKFGLPDTIVRLSVELALGGAHV